MQISVITVCRNAGATLERAIQGILAQRYGAIEYIVVDGASTDTTVEILARYGDRIAHLIQEPDEGIYAAMNKGIRQARGEWLYFANADDYLVDADVMADLVQFVAHHPDCDVVYGDHEARFPSGQVSVHQPVPPDQLLDCMVQLQSQRIHQPASLFKASVFERVGLFDETYRVAADYDWFVRALFTADLTFCYYPRTIVSYAHGGASSQLRRLFEEIFASQQRIPQLQTQDWVAKRLHSMQQGYIDRYEGLRRHQQTAIARKAQIESLEAHMAALEAELAEIKSSQLWAIRTTWNRAKRAIANPRRRRDSHPPEREGGHRRG